MGWGVNDYPTPPEQPMPRCPVCGEECESIFLDQLNNIVGCDCCLLELNAYEWLQERIDEGKYYDI